jgi:hypothetical protein
VGGVYCPTFGRREGCAAFALALDALLYVEGLSEVEGSTSHIPIICLYTVQLVAWTLADIDGVPRPLADHIGRALYLRKAMAS